MGGAVFASDSLPSTSFGISSLIPRPPPGHHLCAAWRQLFQLLSNPLWFPIACLCVLPIVAFFLLKRELPPSIGSLNHEEEEEDLHHHTASYIEKQPEGGEEEEDPLYQRYGSSIEKQTIAREDPLFQRYVGYSASRKMVAALFALYYFIFLYDVLFFGQTLDDLDDFQQNDYTHSIMTEQGDLEVILVFHRWTRPFAAILRNLFVGISWTLEDNSVILHV